MPSRLWCVLRLTLLLLFLLLLMALVAHMAVYVSCAPTGAVSSNVIMITLIHGNAPFPHQEALAAALRQDPGTAWLLQRLLPEVEAGRLAPRAAADLAVAYFLEHGQ